MLQAGCISFTNSQHQCNEQLMNSFHWLNKQYTNKSDFMSNQATHKLPSLNDDKLTMFKVLHVWLHEFHQNTILHQNLTISVGQLIHFTKICKPLSLLCNHCTLGLYKARSTVRHLLKDLQLNKNSTKSQNIFIFVFSARIVHLEIQHLG